MPTQIQRVVSWGRQQTGLCIALLALSLSVFGSVLGMYSHCEMLIGDFLAIVSHSPASSQTVIVGIDERTLVHCGGIPIGRKDVAEVLHIANRVGVRRIYLDQNYSNSSTEEHDDALENALERLGRKRIALPVTTLKGNVKGSNLRNTQLIESIDRFARHAHQVSADAQFDVDGRVRCLGKDCFGEVAVYPNVAEWLVADESQMVRPEILNIDYRIELDSIPVVSFLDVLRGDPIALAAIQEKNIIVGITAEKVVQAIPTPRYGRIERPFFWALATETAMAGSSPIEATLPQTIAFALLPALVLGCVLPGRSFLFATPITVLAIAFWSVVTCAIYQQTNLLFNSAIPIVAILLSFSGAMVATHEAFRKTRQVISSLFQRVDLGLARLFHSGIDAIVTFTPDGRILTVNDTAESLFQIKRDEVIGKSIATILPDFADELLRSATCTQPRRMEGRIAHQGGAERHVDLAFNALPSEDGWVGYASMRDISALKAREEEFKRQASHDALTGLPNRPAFKRHLNATLRFAEDTNQQFAVFLLDLNRFKQVNDTLGHHVGDALLIEVAERFRRAVQNCGLVARLGGDEFAVITSPPTSVDSAETLAHRLVSSLEELVQVQGQQVDTGTSVGIAYYPSSAVDGEELLRLADEAMYQAKRGKVGFCSAPSLVADAT
ncbi:MAG: diguanylate cyclase [Planctomycetales bacterium]|nr:diguanylate cyclase [Planctomycetales bacterium]